MGRTARDKRPYLPPVQRIELSDQHVSRRLILTAALLLLGVGLLVYSFLQFLGPQSEWVTITADSDGGPSSAGDFTLLYCPGGGETTPSAERKGVTALYTGLARRAFQLFHADQSFEGVVNVYDLNRRPNETVEVDPGLYAALEAVVDSGSRALYLGPVYSRYFGVFTCQDDVQLYDFDPRLSEAVAAEYRELCAWANDPDAIGLELLGENKVRLRVSEGYLAYAEREGIEDFIDFSWMTNAFIADFIADGLITQGYTHGALTSYDGFCRNLDSGATGYTLPLYSRQGDAVYAAAELHYTGPRTFVVLRDYPMSERDASRFYTLKNGERRTPYVDPADGLCRNALPELVCYSASRGCGETLLALLPVYVAESFDAGALDALKGQGIESIRWEGFTLRCTDSEAVFGSFYDRDGAAFSAAGDQNS